MTTLLLFILSLATLAGFLFIWISEKVDRSKHPTFHNFLRELGTAFLVSTLVLLTVHLVVENERSSHESNVIETITKDVFGAVLGKGSVPDCIRDEVLAVLQENIGFAQVYDNINFFDYDSSHFLAKQTLDWTALNYAPNISLYNGSVSISPIESGVNFQEIVICEGKDTLLGLRARNTPKQLSSRRNNDHPVEINNVTLPTEFEQIIPTISKRITITKVNANSFHWEILLEPHESINLHMMMNSLFRLNDYHNLSIERPTDGMQIMCNFKTQKKLHITCIGRIKNSDKVDRFKSWVNEEEGQAFGQILRGVYPFQGIMIEWNVKTM